jgi:hypothetical protein
LLRSVCLTVPGTVHPMGFRHVYSLAFPMRPVAGLKVILAGRRSFALDSHKAVCAK